jgi:RNA-directed DNA polymerase
MDNINRSLRGWVNYVHYRNSSLAMSKVRTHAEDRVRTHLMTRHKIKDRGTDLRRLPQTDLYARYGLYKVSTRAGWRSAHALAGRTSESRVLENCVHGLMRDDRRHSLWQG